MEMFNMRRVSPDDDVTGELCRGEPEGVDGGLVQLKLGMNPV